MKNKKADVILHSIDFGECVEEQTEDGIRFIRTGNRIVEATVIIEGRRIDSTYYFDEGFSTFEEYRKAIAEIYNADLKG